MTDDTHGELAVLKMETEILWPAKLESLFAKCDQFERELRGALNMLDLVDPWQQPWPHSDRCQFHRDRADLWETFKSLTAAQK